MTTIKDYLEVNIGKYPNSKDRYENKYICKDIIEEHGQALRIGNRKIDEDDGFPNASTSPYVIFRLPSYMSLMILTGIPITHENMKIYRENSIIRCSMEVMVQNGKYDGKGCYAHWKEGNSIAMHYSSPDDHKILISKRFYRQDRRYRYTENDIEKVLDNINPLRLEVPIWWALMMTMLGLFYEQLPFYRVALETLGIPLTEEDFLKYYYDTYHTYVEGNIVFGEIKIEKINNEDFQTGEPFLSNEIIYRLGIHEDANGNMCNADLCYSQSNIDDYAAVNGCLICYYCRGRVLREQFVRICSDTPQKQLENIVKGGTPLRVKKEMLTPDIESLPPQPPVHGKQNHVASKGVIIMLKGTTGSGKSIWTKEFLKQVKSLKYFISGQSFSVDDIMKNTPHETRPDFKRGIDTVKRNLNSFVQKEGPLFGIIDTCGERYNEKDPQKVCFDISLRNFNVIVCHPNFDTNDMVGYLSFSLYNVLKRDLYSSTTEHYLNPVSAGYETCLRVFNDKSRALFGNNHIEITRAKNINNAIREIESEALRYKASLPSVETSVSDFIARNINI